MMTLENGRLALEFDEKNGGLRLQDLSSGACYCTEEFPCRIENITRENDACLQFDLSAHESRAHIQIILEKNTQCVIRMAGEGPMPGPFSFPGAWIPEMGDQMIYPFGDGISLPAQEAPTFPQTLYFGYGMHMALAMIGILRGDQGIFVALEDGADAYLTWRKESEIVRNQIHFLPSKGEWRYERALRIFVASSDAFSALCHAYRAWRMEQGYVVPLLKKAEHAPGILGMAGRADIWIFDDQNMNRLYGRPVGPEETPRDVRRVVQEMEERGMDRILWNSFEHETPEDVAYLKEHGFEVGHYDIYRDVIPKPLLPLMLPYRAQRSRHTEHCWPQDVCQDEQGKPKEAWQLHGTDGNMYFQHAVCDMSALRMTMEDVPGFIREYGYSSWFIDVASGARPQECYHPQHPMTRRDSLRYINAQNQFLLDMGLINGVEVGGEATASTYVFSEGMMSPTPYRAPDSGRNMNTLYYGDQVPEKIKKFMLNPRIRIPLWQMIYHDCTINYWYWGDSSNCCPEWMPVRDQFNALYGVPPLYSVNMTQWEALKDQIAASYHRASVTARHAAFSPMIRFEYLTADRMVQRTEFENGVSVIANFGTEIYDQIQPGGCRVQKNEEIIAVF